MRTGALILGVGVALLLQLRVPAAVLYEITAIDFGQGLNTGGGKINEEGVVAGSSSGFAEDGMTRRSQLWRWTRSGGFEELGAFRQSGVGNINDSGDIAGTFDPPGDDNNLHRYTDADGFTSIGDLGNGGTSAFDINNAGVIVGRSTDLNDNEPNRAFRWTEAGGMEALPLLPGTDSSSAFAINQAGDIVGSSFGSRGFAVLWPANGGVMNLDVGPSSFVRATDINNFRQVVGWTGFDGFFWDDGEVTLMGNLAGLLDARTDPRAVNDHGQVVGMSQDFVGISLTNNAMIWSLEDGLRDLNDLIPEDSGWVLADAFDINNAGQIVGSGVFTDETGGRRGMGFLLTPIPEPSAALLLFLSSLWTAFLRWR